MIVLFILLVGIGIGTFVRWLGRYNNRPYGHGENDNKASAFREVYSGNPSVIRLGEPSWQFDPYGKAKLRWWDGNQWTDYTSNWHPGERTPPTGWYPDPKGEAVYRWWTGYEWSENTANTPRLQGG